MAVLGARSELVTMARSGLKEVFRLARDTAVARLRGASGPSSTRPSRSRITRSATS